MKKLFTPFIISLVLLSVNTNVYKRLRKMNRYKIATFAIGMLVLSSCISKKKFNALDANYSKVQNESKICDEELKTAQSINTSLLTQKKLLEDQVDYLKKNSSQVLSALQDMSVLSSKQAESVTQSLENISVKDAYIKNLQTAISRKDSLNMNLVLSLKGAIGDLNDKDINIKVEKGVVYIDISDKLLFNSGKYSVTDDAKIVLGKVAKVLNAYPDIEFMVEGFTDNVPMRTSCIDDNWDLSVKRATSLIRILQTQYKVPPERMTAAGQGEYGTVATNDTPEGRAANRRTRIIILPQLDQFFKLLSKK